MSERYGETDDASVGPPVGNDLVDLLDDRSERAVLTGWMGSLTPDLSAAWRRRVGSGFVFGLGTLLAAVPPYHLIADGRPAESLLGDALPMVFGLLLVGTGLWLHWRTDDDATPLVTAFWVTVSFASASTVALYFLALHVSHGHVVESPWFLVYDVAATGAVGGLLISRYDVRARRRHRRLSRQERRFRSVFEGTLDALVITDDEGRYVAANPAAADLFGVTREELVGKHVGDFVDERGFDGRWSTFLDAERQRGEVELVRPDGEHRTVAFAATADVLPGNHLSALRDVTERAEREAQLSEERARVEFLNRLLRHNVLNGMNLVLAKLDRLEPTVPADRRDDFDVVRDRSEEVVDLVQTARQLATDVTTEPGDRCIDVADPVSAAVETVRRAHPDATLEFEPPAETVRVRADQMLETVFDNLLRNAVEHNDPDSIRVTVEVRVGAETVTVTVADDGDGIPPERREQLFEEGYSHTRDWGGFGLSVVDVLVQEFDGRVWAEANDPSGVAFNVELPRAD